MKRFLFICFVFLLAQSLVFAQTVDTGLPMKIGENSNNPTKGNLTGRITIKGLETSQPKPVIFITALFNGVVLDRRQAFDNGTYLIPDVFRENVTVIVEVNGTEYGRQSIQPSVMGNILMDFTIDMQALNSQKTGTITAKNLYSRSSENEKTFEQAATAAKDKKFDEAAQLFKKIVENDPKDFVAWTELGTVYFRNEKLSDAEKAYIGALEQKPDFMLAMLNLGKVYLGQKQLEKAIQILTKAVAADQTNVDALHYLGEAYLQNKQGNNASILFYEAIKLAPIEKAELHLRMAWLYNAKGYKDKAAEEYRQFLQKIPNHPDKEKMEKYIKDNLPK